MRLIKSLLEDGYCSITLAKYRLIKLIRFISKISTNLSIGFIIKLIKIFINNKILFDATVLNFRGRKRTHP